MLGASLAVDPCHMILWLCWALPTQDVGIMPVYWRVVKMFQPEQMEKHICQALSLSVCALIMHHRSAGSPRPESKQSDGPGEASYTSYQPHTLHNYQYANK